MSTIKHPEERKLLSLKLDRRNTYGENAKASRKGIPRAKQLSHQQARSSVARVLARQTGFTSALDIDNVESLVKTKTIDSKRKAFRKQPDAPLGNVLLGKMKNEPASRH